HAGALTAVTPQAVGWPGLRLELAARGRYTWSSDLTGLTSVQPGRDGRPTSLSYANGDALLLSHDAQGRPVQLEYVGAAGGARYRTQLQWRGRQLQRIVHPFEQETRHYDASGRLQRREITRPPLFNAPAARFVEQFRHDDQGRLVQHILPEGGALHYRWEHTGSATRLAALHWEDAAGKRREVISSTPGGAGYQYGNGLQLISAALDSPHADTLALFESQSETLLWRQIRRHDEQGAVLQDSHHYPTQGQQQHLHFAPDAQARMRAASDTRPAGSEQWWYAWQGDGRAAALMHNGQSISPIIQRDVSGLPLSIVGLTLRYGPNRRLESLTYANNWQAQYRHNAFGHRIIKHVARANTTQQVQRSQTTHYLYLHNQLVAEAQSHGNEQPLRITRRYLYAGLT